MAWAVETLNASVDAELDALPADVRARLARVANLITALGLEHVHEPHIKHLEGRLWEMRLKGKDGIAGALRDSMATTRCHRPRLREEGQENSASRNRTCPREGARGATVTSISDLHQKWLQDPAYRETYDALADEFGLAELVIRARTEAGLSQAELAKRIDTTQSVIARLEGGDSKPSTRTLEKIAKATGTRLKISFEPIHGDAAQA